MSAPPLPGVFGSIAPVLDHHGYVAVGGVILLENLGLPFPGEAAVVTGAVFAVTGRMDLTALAVVACVAAIVGSNLGYAIGRRGGRPLLLRAGRRVGITAANLGRAEDFFAQRGIAVIVVSRFLPLLRHLSGLAAGVSRMPWRRFALANAIGAAVWTAIWVVIGDQAGAHLAGVNTALSVTGRYVVPAVVVIVVALLFRRRRRRAEPKPPVSDATTPLAEGATWTS